MLICLWYKTVCNEDIRLGNVWRQRDILFCKYAQDELWHSSSCRVMLRRLVVGLSPQKSGFVSSSLHVRFLVDKDPLEQVFLRIRLFTLTVSFHQCSIFISVYILLLPDERTDESNTLSVIGEHWIRNNFHYFAFPFILKYRQVAVRAIQSTVKWQHVVYLEES